MALSTGVTRGTGAPIGRVLGALVDGPRLHPLTEIEGGLGALKLEVESG